LTQFPPYWRAFPLADDPKSVIIQAARRLDQSGVPIHQLGVQFAQIGDDEDATEALRELDDDLSDAYGIRVSSSRTPLWWGNLCYAQDMVDTTLYNPSDDQFTTTTLIKILLGAINEDLDGKTWSGCE
jgi:hypothetical protein